MRLSSPDLCQLWEPALWLCILNVVRATGFLLHLKCRDSVSQTITSQDCSVPVCAKSSSPCLWQSGLAVGRDCCWNSPWLQPALAATAASPIPPLLLIEAGVGKEGTGSTPEIVQGELSFKPAPAQHCLLFSPLQCCLSYRGSKGKLKGK